MNQQKQLNQDLPEPEKHLRKYILLTFLKEGYLFFSNIYGLLVHPVLTVNKLKKQKDYSQGILIFGLPIALWVGWVLILLVSRLFIFGRLKFGFWAKGSFLFSSFVCALIFSYLIFYLLQELRRKDR